MDKFPLHVCWHLRAVLQKAEKHKAQVGRLNSISYLKLVDHSMGAMIFFGTALRHQSIAAIRECSDDQSAVELARMR